MTTEQIARMIDHTLLKPVATILEIRQLCAEAARHQFYSVCVNPYWLPDCRKELEGTQVKLCTVVGFPLGATSSRAKIEETKACIEAGADEIDMVLNIGAAREGHYEFLAHEIHEIVSNAQGRLVKVILETCYLSNEEIQMACQSCMKAGAHFVKTSTGFGTAGASLEHVRLMRETVGDKLGVKASGGIKDRATALAMIEAGANRLGTSQGVFIVNDRTALDASY